MKDGREGEELGGPPPLQCFLSFSISLLFLHFREMTERTSTISSVQ